VVPPALKDVETLLLRNRIFIERSKGIGVISHDDAINWSLTGPMARGSGVRRDVRKDEPYLCYADNWDGNGARRWTSRCRSPTAATCTRASWSALEEIRQSCQDHRAGCGMRARGARSTCLADEKVIAAEQAGDLLLDRGADPPLREVMTNRGLEPPIGEAYAANETANGELGFYVCQRRRQRCPYPGALPAAELHQLPGVPEAGDRAPDQ
jgi:NADH-quinone oxidoreductase subunit D